MTGLVVADTTVWSNFAHGGEPRWVEVAFPQVRSPRAVLDEIRRGVDLGYLTGFDWTWLREVRIRSNESTIANELALQLDRGEAACIAIAQARRALLLSDDRIARRVARSLNVEVSGTVGVLARLVDSVRLSADEADAALARMIEAGYRSPVRSVSEIL